MSAPSYSPRFAELLDAFLNVPLPERAGWIEALGAEFEDLKPRLRALLDRAAQVENSDFLGTLVGFDPDEDEQGGRAGDDFNAGEIVGGYRLVRPLGAGGMASVWLARRADGLIERDVALKFPHVFRSGAALSERMARERAILATLDHPHIARLYDAGFTPSGRPYLALEYVEGVRIDDYCSGRSASLAERLRLFLQIAGAVAYAHAKLIVHRDIKPANILVTASGEARLLDFGIAKIIESGSPEEHALTQFAGAAMTPDYASPEQILGQPITIAADVYSLGVVLYELLSGERPYKAKAASRRAVEDAVLMTQPVRPSERVKDVQLGRRLRGDLDVIVLKALRKDPADRYATVNALIEDLERYQHGRPVRAQPDSVGYRLRRFVARNKAPTAAAALALAAIVAGAVAALWQARVASMEQQRAEEVKNYIASLFRDADPYATRSERAGMTLSAVELLKQASARADALPASNAETRIELTNLIGASLMNLGDVAEAAPLAGRAVAESARALSPSHPLTIDARLLKAHVHMMRGQIEEMRRELDAVLPHVRAAAAERPENLVRTLEGYAHANLDAGAHDAALAHAREAFDLARARLGEPHPLTAATAQIWAEAHLYGSVTREESLAAAEQALALITRVHRSAPRHPRVIEARHIYGRALGNSNRIDEALVQMEQAIEAAKAIYGPANLSVGYKLENIAGYRRSSGDLKGALADIDAALAILAQHTAVESFTIASARLSRGRTLLAMERSAEALEDLTQSAQIYEQLFGPNHDDVLFTKVHRALALAHAGRTAEALQDVAPIAHAYRTTYRDAAYQPYRPLSVIGAVHRLSGKHAEALAFQQESLQVLGTGASERAKLNAEVEMGLTLVALNRCEEALPFLTRSIEVMTRLQRHVTPQRAAAWSALARAYRSLGRSEDADALEGRVQAFWREFGQSR